MAHDPNDPSYYCGKANIAGNANFQGNVSFADPLQYSSLAQLRQQIASYMGGATILWDNSLTFCEMYAQAQAVMTQIMDNYVDPPGWLIGNDEDLP